MTKDFANACYHCGLPCEDDSPFFTKILGAPRQLCCPGCQAVAESIVANGLEDYYQFRTSPAAKGDDELDKTLATLALYDEPALQEEFVYEQGSHAQIQLTLEGITCAACGWLIEKQLAKVQGIVQVSVNVAQRRAAVTWEKSQVTLSQILNQLKKIGYDAQPFQPDQHEASFQNEHQHLLKKLGLAGLMTMQVMMLMAGLYFDLFGNIAPETKDYFFWVALVLTTPVVFYSGSQFYLGALKALQAKTVNMDVPITIAIFATYFAGIKATLLHANDVYFESICMFIFLLLLSRFLEHRARHKATEISANLTHYVPVSALRIGDDGQLTPCLAKQLREGDIVVVKPGETIPVDGVIEEGEALVDESMLTGEFAPANKSKHAKVYGGTINQTNTLTVKVTATLKHALVSQILRLQTLAMAEKPRIAQLADTFSRYFVLAVLLIAFGSFGVWWALGNDHAFWIMIAVLVATCPCALGLATPTALICAMAKLNKKGVLIKNAQALETLTRVDTIALDKTGTLTEGKFVIAQQWIADDTFSHSDILSIAANLESRSEHPIAHAFTGADFPVLKLSHFNVTAGGGIEATWQGKHWQIGSRTYTKGTNHEQFPLANVFLTCNEQLVAAFDVRDVIKPETKTLLSRLTHYRLLLLSGDAKAQVAHVADQLSLQDFEFEQKPEDKYTHIQALQAKGRRILMMGDGINDAPVMAAADVSIAVGNATDVAKNAADIVLLNPQLTLVAELLNIAKQTKQKIRQNILWAVGYNVIILPFAILGILTPWMAVIGMSLSSIIVVYNSARLLKQEST